MKTNRKLKSISKDFQKRLDAVRNDAIHEVIVEARKIMAKHPHLVEFLMAMGTYYFIDNRGEIVSTLDEHRANGNYVMRDSKAYFKKLNDFINEWDEILKLTGEGMRFKLIGKIVTDW